MFPKTLARVHAVNSVTLDELTIVCWVKSSIVIELLLN